MKSSAAQAFVDELTGSTELAQAFSEAVGDATGDEAKARVLEFARNRGHDLDGDTVVAISALVRQEAGDELSETQLEQVSGGFVSTTMGVGDYLKASAKKAAGMGVLAVTFGQVHI